MNDMSDRAFTWNMVAIFAITIFAFCGLGLNVNEYEGGIFLKSIFRPFTMVVLLAWFAVVLSWLFAFNSFSGCIIAWWIMVIAGCLFQFVFTGNHKDSPYWTRFYDWEHYGENSGVPANDKLNNPHSQYVMPEWLEANKEHVEKHIKDCGCTLEQLKKEAKEHKLFFVGVFENLTGQEQNDLNKWINMRRQYDDEKYFEADTKKKREIAGRLYMNEVKPLLEPMSRANCEYTFDQLLWYTSSTNRQRKIWRWNLEKDERDYSP